MDDLRFSTAQHPRPKPTGLAVETTLLHFAIVTWHVDPDALRAQLDARYEPDCVDIDGVGPRALVSAVTFLDHEFRFVLCPWPKSAFGQTNYRAYVTDTKTGEHVAWFFGTCLDSPAVAVPKFAWGLPWHRAHMAFDCDYDDLAGRYRSFAVETRSRFAPARLQLEDSGEAPRELPGFSNLESGLVLLTHPTRGVFFRRDGSVGTYTIWHDRIRPTTARLVRADYPLFEQLGLIRSGDSDGVHSVLVQRSVDFTIYLPPSRAR